MKIFTADQKYGRTDTSSPVPTSLNQGATLPQAHLQQQAFINAATMPHPYGYSGLAFYPGAGMVAAGGFPAYTAPMYQVRRYQGFIFVNYSKPLKSWSFIFSFLRSVNHGIQVWVIKYTRK